MQRSAAQCVQRRKAQHSTTAHAAQCLVQRTCMHARNACMQHSCPGLSCTLTRLAVLFPASQLWRGPAPWLQAFARLSAVYGGTYMLAKPDVEVSPVCMPGQRRVL